MMCANMLQLNIAVCKLFSIQNNGTNSILKNIVVLQFNCRNIHQQKY